MGLISDKEKEKTVKSVLKLYRIINHIVNNKLVYLENELYTTSRKQLLDIVEGLVPFETKKDEQRFYDKVFVCYTDLQLTKMLEDVRHLVQCYPDDGATYFKILDMLYFNNVDFDSDDVMRILEITFNLLSSFEKSSSVLLLPPYCNFERRKQRFF